MRINRLLSLVIPAAILTGPAVANHVDAQEPITYRASTATPGGSTAYVDRELRFAAHAENVRRYEQQNSLLSEAVDLAMPSIVHIEAIKDAAADATLTSANSEPRRIEEAGAGVIVELGGRLYAVTNRHVIHSAPLRSIHIRTHEQVQLEPLRVWSDPSTDIAVIQVDTQAALPCRLGDSGGIRLGDEVFAVGSPFGLNHSVTRGIISAKGRRNLDLGNRAIDIQDFFQTDAAINPGNSGGPLFNLRGEVIGINTAIASNSGGNEGIGFSIPINMVMSVVEQLVQRGELQRAYLGVQMDNQFDDEKARQYGLQRPVGALVKAVRSQSPAEEAGLMHGDVILSFNGTPIEDDGHLVQTVGLAPLDQAIKVVVLRQKRQIEVLVRLRELPPVY